MNRLLAILAALCLGLNLYNAVSAEQLRGLRVELQERQSYINQGIRLRQVNSQLINALANAAASQNDESIRQVLASEGVTYSLKEEDTVSKEEDAADIDGEESSADDE